MKKAIIFSAIVLLLLVIIAMIPIPKATVNNMEKVRGLVGEIYPNGTNNIIVKLVDDDNYYFIKGARDLGIDYKNLKNNLLYQDVEIGYVRNWSIFGKSNNLKPICLVKSDEQVVFSTLVK